MWEFKLLSAVYEHAIVCHVQSDDGRQYLESLNALANSTYYECQLPDEAIDLQVSLAINGSFG